MPFTASGSAGSEVPEKTKFGSVTLTELLFGEDITSLIPLSAGSATEIGSSEDAGIGTDEGAELLNSSIALLERQEQSSNAGMCVIYTE